ncbi:hypothetical protein, partial [Mesorhizobium sp. CO1-1-8]|uniref:hypothetical protein n=1 Tax=Mesorhizobium sp. CO1-1-8 TaxID=2876631 RepID=UPI001CD06290
PHSRKRSHQGRPQMVTSDALTKTDTLAMARPAAAMASMIAVLSRLPGRPDVRSSITILLRNCLTKIPADHNVEVALPAFGQDEGWRADRLPRR